MGLATSDDSLNTPTTLEDEKKKHKYKAADGKALFAVNCCNDIRWTKIYIFKWHLSDLF